MALELAGNDGTFQNLFNGTNEAVIDVHDTMVSFGQEIGLGQTVQAVVKLGESAGPGFIGVQPNPYGDSNLVTDILNAPDTILFGDVEGLIDQVGVDVGQILSPYTTNIPNVLLQGTDPLNPIPEVIDLIDGGSTVDGLVGNLLDPLSTGGLLGSIFDI